MTRTRKCKICDREIASDSFEFHRKHGHDLGGKFDKVTRDDEFDEDDDGVDFLQPSLDASKNIGYPCRETGKYGSYSAHDGFDDESWS